jgi:hypothetical protein
LWGLTTVQHRNVEQNTVRASALFVLAYLH